MALLLPIVIKKSQYRLLTVTLKYDNGGGQAMLLTHDQVDEVRDRLIIEHKLDLTRPDEITEKNTNKGYNRTLKYSNVLELLVSRLVQLHGYFLVDMSGILCEDFAQRVGPIASSERAGLGHNDVLNDSTTQEVNWHRHVTRVDLAIDYYNTNSPESGTASNKVTRTKEIEVWYQQYNRRTHGYDKCFSGGSIRAHE